MQLAEITGIDNTTLSKINAGTHIPTFDAAVALELAFGVPVSKLFPERLARIQDAVIGLRSVEHQV